MGTKSLLLLIGGYLTVVVEGSIEGFINLCIDNGLDLADLQSLSSRKISFKVSLRDFKRLTPLLEESKCSLKVVEKRGLSFLISRVKKRKMLLLGGVLFVVLMYTLSSFIWFVEVYSHQELNRIEERKAVDIAKNVGLKPGVLKKSIDFDLIEKALAREIPEVSWVGVRFFGTKAIIELVERRLPDAKHLDKEPKDIVAEKDGIIEEILVLSGQALVTKGDVVEKGQVLISGVIIAEGENEEPVDPRLVTARGVVRARVSYEGKYRIALLQSIVARTGARKVAYALQMPHGRVFIKGSHEPSFANYQTETSKTRLPIPTALKNSGLPKELIKLTFYEVQVDKRVYQKEEAIRLALPKIKAGLKLPADSRIAKQKIDLLAETSSDIFVKATIETIEDISMPLPIA